MRLCRPDLDHERRPDWNQNSGKLHWQDWSQEMSEVKKTDHSADVLASIRSQVPTCYQNQESKRVRMEIIKSKKEQGEEKQDSTYSIRSTDKVDLEEFDLKSALFSHMNKKKSANRITDNYHLYHALMEALIAEKSHG
ncbi:hypothetical protein Tco_0088025 [Tanacetum coccineum]